MPEKRKKFDSEFRAGAVRIVAETGKPIAAGLDILARSRTRTDIKLNNETTKEAPTLPALTA